MIERILVLTPPDTVTRPEHLRGDLLDESAVIVRAREQVLGTTRRVREYQMDKLGIAVSGLSVRVSPH